MFEDYAAIDIEEICFRKSITILNKLSELNEPQLVTSLIKPLVNSINNRQKNGDKSLRNFHDDKDVHWIMEVIGYGLTLPLTDNEQYEAVRDCVNIYCEWLHTLSPSLSEDKFIPNPIRQDPNLYCQKMIGHLFNVFLPRSFGSNQENSNDLISKQALICHRILRLLINIATEPNNCMDDRTWEALLQFLLGINHKLLRSQYDPNDVGIGTQISDRVISTLFQGWLLSCVHYFPSPSYWRTLQNVCCDLRHCPALISQWNRVNICLTRRLVTLLYKHDIFSFSIENKVNFMQFNQAVMLLSEDALKQCWYRFLHIIGNPMDLCNPKLIFKNISSSNANHLLPFIFHKAIKGICTLVDIFLGLPEINLNHIEYDLPKFFTNHTLQSTTPPEKRKSNFSVLNKGDKFNRTSVAFSSTSSVMSSSSSNQLAAKMQQNASQIFPMIMLMPFPLNFIQNHCKLTSILDVFGEWLFQASFFGSKLNHDHRKASLSSSTSTSSTITQTNSNEFENQHHQYNLHTNDPTMTTKLDALSPETFESGQAEALGTLCKIFCLKKDDEDISQILSQQNHLEFVKLRNYLTGFYIALKVNLTSIHENKIQIVSSILVNSVRFFETDLPGSKILMPHFFRCVEFFLGQKEKSDTVSFVLIRNACIKILISLISLLLHYRSLPVKDSLMDYSCATLISYYPRLILNLILGLHNETDHNNIQMILNALLFVVEDCCNQSDTIVFQQSPTNHESSFPFNLYDFFNKEDFDFDEVHRDRMLDINLFLLINSIVADILCKSSLRNSNYNISLTALEILSALAQIRKFDSDGKKNYLCNQKCSLFIRKICEFIENQCYKPSMFHSKDMHSTIVAAYQCLCVWIHEHLHLIKDLDCITILFELIELGISGTKSKKGEEFKSDKILKPASLRVREAAELLLNTMMSRMEFSSGLRNRDDIIIDCDLNELKINEIFTKLKMKSASLLNNFRHFVVDNSILISIFDGEIDNEETVCFVRSAYGKYCFALKNRFVSKRKNERNSSVDRSNLSEKHFDNYDSIPSQNFIYFPEFYDQIATTKHDSSILKLQKFVNENENLREDFETMQNFLEKVEQNLSFEKAKLSIGTSNITELVEPAPTDSFEAFRLVMSQFEIFNFDLKNISPMKNSSLTLLQDGNGDFINHLSRLDLVSGKMNDFIMIFYVPKDFICEDEILFASSYQYLHNSTFRSFLNMLGKRISCNTKLASNLFYWNDVLHETIFISPHKPENILDKFSLDIFIKESNESIRQKFFQKSSSNGVDGDDAQQSNLVREFFYHNLGCDVKIFVFWIEKIEDFDRLPFNNIDVKEESDYQHHSNPSSDSQRKQFSIIINPLKNGLFRVFNYSTGINRSVFTIDRMILSKQLLATYVRFFALNSFRRRRMNIESFQLPHVKRRLKIQEIANKFKSNHDPLKSIGDIFKPKVF